MDRKEYQKQWHLKHRERRLEDTKKKRQELYQWFRDYKKTLVCERCGENHPATLDFHHKDRSIKEACINRMVASKLSKEKIMKEIEKCSVVCSNCHRIIHYEMRNYGPEAQ